MVNLANTPPPTTLTIAGEEFPIDTDYYTWIRVIDLFDQLDFTEKTQDGIRKNFRIIVEIKKLVFGQRIRCSLNDLIIALTEFISGYPTAKKESGKTEDSDSELQTVDFMIDLNLIITAIRNQSGIDLSYKRKKPFHWWLFLVEFQALEDHHQIRRIMQIRSYRGTDPEYLKLRNRYALPPKRKTYAEQRAIEYYDQLFYNT